MAGTSAEQIIDFDLLPGQLKIIARQCGLDCMWAVWRHYANGVLFVPIAVDAGHPLAVTLGLEYAQLMCAHFAAERLYIAKAHGAQLAIRNQLRNLAIIEERKNGSGLFEISRRHDLSQRQVINILNAEQQPSANVDIFEM